MLQGPTPNPTSQPIDSRAIKKPQASNTNGHCFRCGETSHITSDCQKGNSWLGKQLLINNDDMPDNEEALDPTYDEDNKGEDDYMFLGDTDESLIIRKKSSPQNEGMKRISCGLTYSTQAT